MCLRFDACFGVVHDCGDDDYHSPSAKGHTHTAAPAMTTPHQPPPPAQRNGLYYGHAQHVHHGNDHRPRHHQPPAAAGEAVVTRGPAPAVAKDGRGYAVSDQETAGADETLKHPVRYTMVGEAGHRAHYFYAPAGKDDTTECHYHTTTGEQERY